MSYTVEKKDGNATVGITIVWGDLSDSFEKNIVSAAKKAKDTTSMKGFRKGHVPDDIAKGQVDRMQVLSQTVDEVVRTEFSQAVRDEKLKIAGNPQVNMKKMAEGNDVELDLIVALIPDVALPADWKKIVSGVNKDHVEETFDVSEDDITAEVVRIAESRSENIPVTRAAQEGDEVKIDFDVKIDDVIIEGGSSKDHALVLGKGAFIPGFEDHVVGMKTGEEKSFALSFPETYHAKHLAGQKATFEVKLGAVEERKIPAIDDAFAQSLGGTFDTVDALKKNISEGMLAEKKNAHEEGRKTAYLEGLSDASDMTIPQALLDDEIARMRQEMEGQIAQSGMTFDDYLQQMGKTNDDLQEMWKPQAQKRIKSALLLEKLGEEFGVEPSTEDIQAEMNKTLQMYQGMKDMENQIDMQQLFSYTKGIMRNNEVFDRLAKMK